MNQYVHRCLIVPVEHVQLARHLTAVVAGPAGEHMFMTRLSADGGEPATHYISSGMIETSMAALLDSPQTLFDVASEYVTAQQCDVLLSDCDISDDKPFEALQRLGLEIVQGQL